MSYTSAPALLKATTLYKTWHDVVPSRAAEPGGVEEQLAEQVSEMTLKWRQGSSVETGISVSWRESAGIPTPTRRDRCGRGPSRASGGGNGALGAARARRHGARDRAEPVAREDRQAEEGVLGVGLARRMRPILPASSSVNQTLPSGPTVMPSGLLLAVGIPNPLVKLPLGVMRPMAPALNSVNQGMPSSPVVMMLGSPQARGTR
jgi:hypothetical protein